MKFPYEDLADATVCVREMSTVKFSDGEHTAYRFSNYYIREADPSGVVTTYLYEIRYVVDPEDERLDFDEYPSDWVEKKDKDKEVKFSVRVVDKEFEVRPINGDFPENADFSLWDLGSQLAPIDNEVCFAD